MSDNQYLKDNNLEYIETKKATDKDLENSPFEKTYEELLGYYPHTINGSPYRYLQYQIIIASRNKKRYHIWVRIKTEFFSNPALTFAEKEE